MFALFSRKSLNRRSHLCIVSALLLVGTWMAPPSVSVAQLGGDASRPTTLTSGARSDGSPKKKWYQKLRLPWPQRKVVRPPADPFVGADAPVEAAGPVGPAETLASAVAEAQRRAIPEAERVYPWPNPVDSHLGESMGFRPNGLDKAMANASPPAEGLPIGGHAPVAGQTYIDDAQGASLADRLRVIYQRQNAASPATHPSASSRPTERGTAHGNAASATLAGTGIAAAVRPASADFPDESDVAPGIAPRANGPSNARPAALASSAASSSFPPPPTPTPTSTPSGRSATAPQQAPVGYFDPRQRPGYDPQFRGGEQVSSRRHWRGTPAPTSSGVPPSAESRSPAFSLPPAAATTNSPQANLAVPSAPAIPPHADAPAASGVSPSSVAAPTNTPGATPAKVFPAAGQQGPPALESFHHPPVQTPRAPANDVDSQRVVIPPAMRLARQPADAMGGAVSVRSQPGAALPQDRSPPPPVPTTTNAFSPPVSASPTTPLSRTPAATATQHSFAVPPQSVDYEKAKVEAEIRPHPNSFSAVPPPTQPAPAGAAPSSPPGGGTPAAGSGVGPSGATLDEGSQVLAMVGDQSVLASDVLWQVDTVLAPYQGKAPEAELQEQRKKLVKQFLPGLVTNKMVYLDFLKSLPPERLPDLQSRIVEVFKEQKLPELIEQAGVATAAELDAQLREKGSSLVKQQQLFTEDVLGKEMLRQNIRVNDEITHQEYLDYYHSHVEEYSHPARARFEQLMVRWDEFETRQAALARLASLGNKVQQGEEFADVARQGSQGARAAEGGQFDWTTQGALRSTVIDDVIFSIPEGVLSRIVEDEQGAYIVRVQERELAGRDDFGEVQESMRKAIREQRFNEQVTAYLEDVKARTTVWTVFDEEQVAQQDDGGRLR